MLIQQLKTDVENAIENRLKIVRVFKYSTIRKLLKIESNDRMRINFLSNILNDMVEQGKLKIIKNKPTKSYEIVC